MAHDRIRLTSEGQGHLGLATALPTAWPPRPPPVPFEAFDRYIDDAIAVP